jgi:hypothetical protein
MRPTILVSRILLPVYVLSFSLPGLAQDAQDMQKSCRVFVQSFYDWYVKRPELPRALKYRASAFSHELFQQMKEDREAQAKSPGDIAGLDFDPILNSQDPAEHYVVGRVKLSSQNNCWIEIHSGFPGKENTDAYVGAELTNDGVGWKLVNFQYATTNSDFSASVASGGLLGVLKELREARRRAANSHSDAQPTRKPQRSVPAPTHPKPGSEPTPRN